MSSKSEFGTEIWLLLLLISLVPNFLKQNHVEKKKHVLLKYPNVNIVLLRKYNSRIIKRLASSLQICIEFCKIDSSIIEEMGPIDIDLFESQVQGIVPMNDLASHLSLILHSLVLPELKTNESEGLALNRAKQFLSILSHSC